ncbi:MAG: FAD-dependent cmnm(5)s(2)U34 oxidoreductase, partial [Burkholderiales bacterium]|nr:FAD-dependent cmnm(5)s(2)U34 oxidoreductase [Burkholderiales bacterium]
MVAASELQAWRGSRCVSADRLPLLGPLIPGPDQGLWLCAAMGSRGLSLAVLCAELLAARWGAEPLPVDAALARTLDADRG